VRLLRVARRAAWPAAGASGLWLVDGGALVRVDPRTNEARTMARLGRSAGPLALGLGSAWIVDSGGAVVRVDERTGRTLARVRIGKSPSAVAVGGGSVWVLRFDPQSERTRLVRIDPRTNRVSGSRPLPGFPSSVCFGAGSVWVGELVPSPLLVRIDPRTLAARTLADLSG
jgi:streptogramin lyase